MKILFMGTPEFAKENLKALCEDGENEIVGVISQPDKPQGRHMELIPTSVKAYALSQGIQVYQPETLKDNAILPLLEELRPELIVVVAYGKILPEYVLDFPKYGCVNMHASLLPRFRGAAPIQRAVMAGDKRTGITAMYMEKGLDTGDMIMKAEVEIGDEQTSGELHDVLAELGGKVLLETVRLIEGGEAKAEKQDDSKATYAHMLTKAEGEIDWSNSAQEIKNRVRGLNPWPMAFTFLGGKRIVIDRVTIAEGSGEPGEVISSDDALVVACGEGAVRIDSFKPEGKKKMPAKEYLRGHKIDKGEKLGR
ncbi:MAG: methionyl-tRNA formyltransferase [Oscillospiraceae bacterium]|nr:methionyl-tRNA formyltransferase [Oscillospiraceae bacterium]